MFDFRMFIVRVGSAAAIAYGAQEFMRDPANLEELLKGSDEIMSEVYEWGHNKFMGIADNSTQLEVKKSAREIFKEAFMDDERDAFRTSTQFVEYADEEAVKEAQEEFKRRMAEADEDEENEAIDLDGDEAKEQSQGEVEGEATSGDATGEGQAEEEEGEDLLDKLTGNVEDEAEEEAVADE